MFYVNLHNLPAGQSMYTLYVTLQPEGTPRADLEVEEIDVVAPAGNGWKLVAAAAADEVLDTYGAEARVVGVVDQSAGEVLYDNAG